MLNTIKKLFNKQELLKGNFGIEREGLRVDYEGKLSTNPHPEVFGYKMKKPIRVNNTYIFNYKRNI